MKKLSICLFVLLITCIGNSQTKFGAKAGLNISNFSGDIENGKSKTGFYIGGYARIPLAPKFTFQPEVLFSMQGAKERTDYDDLSGSTLVSGSVEANYKLNYINIPMMFQYEVADRLRVEAGPQFGFNVGKKSEIDFKTPYYSYTLESDAEIKILNFSLNIGAGYELQNGLNFSTRYSFGLSNVSDVSDYNIKNSVFSVGAGYTF